MAGKVTRYMVRYSENATGRRRTFGKEFTTKAEAKEYVKRLTSKGKVNSYGLRGTACRDTLSFGANNPRIVKREVYR